MSRGAFATKLPLATRQNCLPGAPRIAHQSLGPESNNCRPQAGLSAAQNWPSVFFSATFPRTKRPHTGPCRTLVRPPAATARNQCHEPHLILRESFFGHRRQVEKCTSRRVIAAGRGAAFVMFGLPSGGLRQSAPCLSCGPARCMLRRSESAQRWC